MFIRRIRLDLTRSLASLVMLANLFFFCSSYAQAGQIKLAWDASTSSGVAGYQLSYGQTSGIYATQVDAGNQTSYTVTGLSDGATYYFAAKAYNSGKTTYSGFSNQVSATIPSSPTVPTAGFNANPTSGTAPLAVTFTDTSTGNITAWSWNFGDGTTSSSKNATKIYTSLGGYTVRLTVTGPAGSNTATRTISVAAAAPVASFTATPVSGTAPLAVRFSNSSTGNVSGSSWSFGDGGTSTASSPAYTYTTAGTYPVSLTVTGSNGTNTKTQNGYITVSSSGGGGGNAGLVGAYNFEEASGTTVVDASGQGNTGTISGATPGTLGRVGKALSFDGVNDRVTVNDAPSLDLSTAVTLEAWVYPTKIPGHNIILGKVPQDGSHNYPWFAYSLHVLDTRIPRFTITAGGSPAIVTSPDVLAENVWTHIAGVYDGSTIKIYINGVQKGSVAKTGTILNTTGSLKIGANGANGEPFQGTIDEVRIYNRALSAANINTDMNTSVPSPSPSTPAPTASFSTDPLSGTAPLTVTFADTSTGNITARSWSFGDGTTSTATSGAKSYSTPGTYTMSLTVTGPGGSNAATRTISVAAAAPVASFTATPVSGTAPLAVSFSNSSTGNVSGSSWSFGDGGTSTASSPAYTYTTAGTYPVSLTVTGSNGTNTKTQNGYITVSSSGGGGSNAGLVGAYNFEEASGTTVVDASGQGNTGTISGATPGTLGRFAKALSFDGVDDRVTVKDAPSLDLSTAVTLEAWVYPTKIPGHNIILGKVPQDGSHNYPWFAYSLHVLDTRIPRFTITAGGSPAIVTSPDVLAENVWTHIAGVYDGSTIKIYINGVQKGSVAKTGTILNTTGSLKIGANGANGEPFQGTIDEVRIYNRALSATEIQTDMNRSVATSSPPVTLVGTKTIGPVADSNPKGKAEAFQSTAAVTGMVTSLSVYVDTGSTATTLVAGLYTDTNGHPGTVLAQGTLSSPTAGSWNTVALPAKSLTVGTKYWIAVLGPSGVLTFRDAVGSTSHPSETSAQTTLTTLPSTWTTGSPSFQGPVSAYGVGY